jgi:hypothetical protein
MQATTAAILMQADEILVKPLGIPELLEVIHRKLGSRIHFAACCCFSMNSCLKAKA